MKSIFSKHWDQYHGFTMEEAEKKKIAVDEAHGVNQINAKWKPAKILSDPEKKDGYMVVIETKA
ncbi:MAG: hypothetical protein J5507_01380 [Clostridia bacterium]|nr:hypothetical protein [Clostridia bacterium]